MSNNKQSVKLYTEEQVREMLENAGRYPRQIDFLLENLTPIELPSDEEIKKEMEYYKLDPFDLTYFEGISYMRDKIQGGNNEQQ